MTNQAFIYFRHTSRGVEFFASRELCRRVRVAGTTKTHYSKVDVLTERDPAAGVIRSLMRGLLARAKADRTVGQTPTSADLVKFLEPVATGLGIDASFHQAEGILPSRILVTL
jgi:hypothetical protein